MPFGVVFDEVYRVLLAPALRAAGYEVARADTTLNQRAIMQDVIRGLLAADVVVADLTGQNPNVFYELGIAHVLEKPVVLLAQRTDDIPFDLKAYRAVIYTLEFTKEPRLRPLPSDFVPLMQAARRGEIAFSSPYLDFRPPVATMSPFGGSVAVAAVGAVPTLRASGYVTLSAAGPPTGQGFLETLAELQRDVPEYAAALNEITSVALDLSTSFEQATAKLQEAPVGHELDHTITVAGNLAHDWDSQSARFEHLVETRLAPMALLLERAAVALIGLSSLGNQADTEDENLGAIRELARTAEEAARSIKPFPAVIRQLSTITSSTIEPGRRLASAIDSIAANLDRIASLEDLLGSARG